MKILYFIGSLLLPVLCAAQISLGVTAGSNMGKFGGYEPPDAEYTARTGLNFGGTIAYRINSDISLTLQPMYSQRGSNIEVGEDSWNDTLQVYEVKIDFLIIPIFVRVDADNGVTYFISGIEFGIPLSAKLAHADQEEDVSQDFNSIDILASIGMGLRFSLGAPDLMIEFRYYQGLVNFNSGEYLQAVSQDFKNTGFQLMAGLEWEM